MDKDGKGLAGQNARKLLYSKEGLNDDLDSDDDNDPDVATSSKANKTERSDPVDKFRAELKNFRDDLEQNFEETVNIGNLIASLRATRLMKSTKFRLTWEEFVKTVKVHEMLKCLEVEHRKLKILKKHTCEVQNSNKSAKIAEALRSGHSLADDGLKEDGAENEMDEVETENEKKSPRYLKPSKSLHKGSSRASSDDNQPPVLSNLTLKETEVEKMTKRKNITDEEFEQIVALCEDKFEQKALREAFAEKRNRDKYLHNASELRRMTYDFINGQFFANFMFFIIILSTFGIFLLTFELIALHYQFPLVVMDSCVMAIFIVEAALKIYIYKTDYFTEMWNLSDMLIVIVHFVEVFVDLVTNALALSTDLNSLIYFKILKSMRALRLPRIIKFMPNLQVIVSTIIQSFLSLGSIGVLMVLFIYVFAVMGRGLFTEENPEKFGSIFNSALTLFQLLTLDDWFEIVQNIDIQEKPVQYWLNFFFLFGYIVIEYFVFLNLFVAVLVENFQISLAEAEVKKEKETINYSGEEENTLTAEDIQLFSAQTSGTGRLPGLNKEEEESISEISEDESDADSQFELDVEDYYGHEKGSSESLMVGKVLKYMTSVDLQRFIWGRRLTVLNGILDRATLTRANTYLKTRKQQEEEALLEELDDTSEEETEEDKEFKELRKQTNSLFSTTSVHKLF